VSICSEVYTSLSSDLDATVRAVIDADVGNSRSSGIGSIVY
jgi:hypothetical protein